MIILIPLFLLAQEEEANEHETYFQELIKNLNPSADTLESAKESAEETAENSEETVPLPAALPAGETTEKTEEAPEGTESAVLPAPLPVPVADETPLKDTAPAENVTDNDSTDVPLPDSPVAEKPKKEKQPKPEKVKKEREPKEYVPFIEPAVAKNKSQGKYVKKLEKAPERRMRLITFDQADIIHGRKYRSVTAALENPSNLGVRSEYFNTFSIIPINTIDININTSTRPFVLLEEYFSTGELLSEAAEDSLIDMLGPNGLELPIDISFPTLFSLKMAPVFGSFYLNSGLFIKERSRIPSSFFDIIFEGATFDDPYQMTDPLGVSLNLYLKNSLGFGSYIELPAFFGEIRFGAAANVYAGAFSSVNITDLELVPAEGNTSLQGSMEVLSFADTLNIFGEDGFQFHIVDDYMGIPKITYGADIGVAWRFKLNRVLPFAPGILKNYFDLQLGIEDLGASIAMNHAYLREISFEAEAGDLLETFGGEFSLDSIMVVEENLISADSTVSMPLGSKFKVSMDYQPIPQLLLKGSWSTYITDGLNATNAPNYSYGVEIYPVSSLCIHGSVTQKSYLRYWEAGLKLYSMKSEFGLKARLYDLDFSVTENLSGAGIMLNWARYFYPRISASANYTNNIRPRITRIFTNFFKVVDYWFLKRDTY
jgi:hypothetical protein